MDWHHAPRHRTTDAGLYFVTAATYLKQHLLRPPDRDHLLELFVSEGDALRCSIRAWVVLVNHYHVMINASANALDLLLKRVHSKSALRLNKRDGTKGRQAWFQYWEKSITHPKSYFARLNYIHQNPVRHGIVFTADQYAWSSYSSFENGDAALARKIKTFKIDKLQIYDDFGALDGAC